jgi:hypothetical protein
VSLLDYFIFCSVSELCLCSMREKSKGFYKVEASVALPLSDAISCDGNIVPEWPLFGMSQPLPGSLITKEKLLVEKPCMDDLHDITKCDGNSNDSRDVLCGKHTAAKPIVDDETVAATEAESEKPVVTTDYLPRPNNRKRKNKFWEKQRRLRKLKSALRNDETT